MRTALDPPRRARRRRLTQQQRSATTQQALLDAALGSLIELGYERSTTIEITERAGLSRGGQQHHFPTRAGLMAAVVRNLAERAIRGLQESIDALPEGPKRPAAALDMMWQVFNAPLFQVILELSVHARTDPELRAALDPIERVAGHDTTPLIRAAFGVDAGDRSVDNAINLILATVRGLVVMQLLEPKHRINNLWSRSREYLLEIVTAALDQPSGTRAPKPLKKRIAASKSVADPIYSRAVARS